MKATRLRNAIRLGLTVLAALALVAGGIKLYTLRTHDPGDPRSRTNGYLMTHTVLVARAPEQVFQFITYRMGEFNLALAKAHQSFRMLRGDALTAGAMYTVEEGEGDELVRNTYTVREAVPNRLIHLASVPSQVFRRTEDGLKQVATCNAYVYFDLAEAPGGTALTQTVVVEMPNFLMKFVTDIAAALAEENVWQQHLEEELTGLKAVIERHG